MDDTKKGYKELTKDTVLEDKKAILVNITHSQANIVEKNANRLQAIKNFFNPEDEVKLKNINTISLGSPEYAGKDTNHGDVLKNSSQAVGANFIQGFNNENDSISLFGANERENANKDVKKDEDGHKVEFYNEHLLNQPIIDKLETILDIKRDNNVSK